MWISIVAAVLASVGLVVASPLFLMGLGDRTGIDWANLSDVGQTYGAASAVLSAIALLAVAVSLVFQAKETRQSREQAKRALHMDLLRIAIENPAFQACWGFSAEDDQTGVSQRLYSNLIVSFWAMNYETGAANDLALRDEIASMFRSAVGRNFWAQVRLMWRGEEQLSRRRRGFVRIIDDEYQKAVEQAERLPQSPNGRDGDHTDPAQVWSSSGSYKAIVFAALGGVVAGRVLNRYVRIK